MVGAVQQRTGPAVEDVAAEAAAGFEVAEVVGVVVAQQVGHGDAELVEVGGRAVAVAFVVEALVALAHAHAELQVACVAERGQGAVGVEAQAGFLFLAVFPALVEAAEAEPAFRQVDAGGRRIRTTDDRPYREVGVAVVVVHLWAHRGAEDELHARIGGLLGGAVGGLPVELPVLAHVVLATQVVGADVLVVSALAQFLVEGGADVAGGLGGSGGVLVHRDDQVVAELAVLEVGVGGHEVDQVTRIDAVVEAAGQAGAGAHALVVLDLDLGGQDAAIGLAFVQRLHVVGEAALLAVRAGNQHADVVVGAEALAHGGVEALVGAVAKLVLAHAHGGVQGQIVAVQCALGADVDVAGDGIAVHVRGDGLGHFQGRDHVGGNGVQLHAAGGGVGIGQRHAVDGDGGVFLGRAAHGHVAAFALVALDRHAGDALGGFGDVVVREPAQQVGRDHVGVVDGVALLVQGQGLGVADAAHFDLVHGHRFGACGVAVQAQFHAHAAGGIDFDIELARLVAQEFHGDAVAARGQA